MKKNLVIALMAVMLIPTINASFAKTTTNSDLADAIKYYKAGNYSGCYEKVEAAIKKDPSNPLSYYYKAMTAAQIGKKDEAIANYEKALSLSTEKSNLRRYAEKGKRCLEDPDKCQESQYDDAMDQFIRGKSISGFSEEAMEMFERLKIEQMMRDMNRDDNINPQKFKEYKDFSSMNAPSQAPNNDEIVAAVRTLQNAGLLNFGTNNYSDLSLLTGSQRSLSNIENFANMDPRLIQTMLTNGMSLGF